MDSGFGTNLEGFLIHGNLSLNPSAVPIVDGDGSLEASGTIYIDKIREYNNLNGIDIQNVMFNTDSVEIPFSNPSDISTGTLLLNGGITLNNTTDSISLTSGGTITTLGGVSIGKKLNVGGVVNVNNNTMPIINEDSKTRYAWIPFGVYGHDDFFTAVTAAYNVSTTNAACVEGLADLIYGKGLYSKDQTKNEVFLEFIADVIIKAINSH